MANSTAASTRFTRTLFMTDPHPLDEHHAEPQSMGGTQDHVGCRRIVMGSPIYPLAPCLSNGCAVSFQRRRSVTKVFSRVTPPHRNCQHPHGTRVQHNHM